MTPGGKSRSSPLTGSEEAERIAGFVVTEIDADLRSRIVECVGCEDLRDVAFRRPPFEFGRQDAEQFDRELYEEATAGVAVEFFAASSTVGWMMFLTTRS
jgi:hypothetical protein